MRSLVSVWIVICLAVLLLPAATVSAESRVALRAEGYIGYSKIDLGFFDEDTFQGGGTGSASLVVDQLYLQGDVFGDAMDFDVLDTDTVGGGVHFGWRDAERGSVGAVGVYNNQDRSILSDSLDIWRAGLEGELFLDRVTLGLNSGYLQIDDDSTGYFDAGIQFYPIDRARLSFSGGVFDIEEDDPFGVVGAGGEFLLVGPLAAFARWEATFVDTSSVDIDQHSVVVGVRLYWGADEPTLLTYDRAHFKRACSGYLLAGGRLC